MKNLKKILAPFLILLLSLSIVVLLIMLRPKPKEVPPERPVTRVEVTTVQPQSVRLTVKSQGTLLPRVESQLAAEVSGRIVEMSPHFRAGGHFKTGDVLFRIDPADYDAAVAARKADLATARLTLAQEKALAEQAAADWAALGQGEASALTLRQPQLAQAAALVVSAEAALERARRDLERTKVRAPYDGMVLSKSVDLGQFVTANSVADIFAIRVGEIRLPVVLREANFLMDPAIEPSPVQLSTKEAGVWRTWEARLVRFEATVDPASRLIYAVAEIEEPFAQELRRGMFLEAEIEGRQLDGVFVLPRFALRGSNTVYVVSEEGSLTTRVVEIVKTDAEKAILSGGLAAGDRVVTSPIAYFVENMPVEIETE